MSFKWAMIIIFGLGGLIWIAALTQGKSGDSSQAVTVIPAAPTITPLSLTEEDIAESDEHVASARDYLVSGDVGLGMIEIDQALFLNPRSDNAVTVQRSLRAAATAKVAQSAPPAPARPASTPAPTIARTDEEVRLAVVNYGCPGTTLGLVISLAATIDDQKFDGSSVTGSTSGGRVKLVSFYTKSQGGGRSAEYKFSYDTTNGKVAAENPAGVSAMNALSAARCRP